MQRACHPHLRLAVNAPVKPVHDDGLYPDLASAPSIIATAFGKP